MACYWLRRGSGAEQQWARPQASTRAYGQPMVSGMSRWPRNRERLKISELGEPMIPPSCTFCCFQLFLP